MSMFAKNNQGDTWNLAYLRMFGNKFYSDDGQLVIADANGKKALQWMVDNVNNSYTNPHPESVTSNDCNAMFVNQRLAISFTNSILFGNILNDMAAGNAPRFDARLANIPGDPRPLTFTYLTGSFVFDTNDEIRIKGAKDFVNFYSSDEELVRSSINGVPVRKSVAAAYADQKPLFAAYDANAQYMFNFTGNLPGYTELRQTLYPELQAAFIGKKTAAQALANYQAAGNAVLREARADSVLLND